ncbi:Uma2 family endonuclease [soil metagenome]
MDEHRNKLWTYDDLVAMDGEPDGNKYEIFDGELVVSPSPSFSHQEIVKRLFVALLEQVEKRRLATVHFAPLDVILSKTRVVQPDLLVIGMNQREIIAPHGVIGAPVLAIEVVSPGNASHDRVRKRRFYARGGIREYWIVDPASYEIEVLGLVAGGLSYRQTGWFGPGDTLTSPTFELAIAVNAVFDLPEADAPP